MEIPVLVERVEGGGYRARTGEPFGIMAEGITPELVLRCLREQIERRLVTGAQLVQMNVSPSQEHPSAKSRGNWNKDDPVIKRWEQYVEEYRRQIDGDPNIP